MIGRSLVLAGFALAFVAPDGANALTFRPTVYSDGYSCPANCDAHVVFDPDTNGTKYAFLPSSTRSKPLACIPAQDCRICFSDADDSCLTVMFRKAGPAPGRFDFTPAFYEATCPKPDIPAALVAICKSFDKEYSKLTDGKVYCLADPTHEGCNEVVAAANKKREQDQPLWDECRKLGEKAFNKKYAATPAKQRANDCAYESRRTGGPNKKGERWRRLLPAACWPNTYVGRDGTDCCDTNKMSLGGLGNECSPFLVRK